METKWIKVRSAFDFFQERDGTFVTIDEIAKAAGWAIGNARTYISKKWSGILSLKSDGSYLVLLPPDLTWEKFQSIHTQVLLVPKTPTPPTFDYDVALSFAGEDRPYVSEVASVLKAYGINVFYDSYEQNTLWGKDLYAHLDEVYRLRSRFCVIFISKHYEQKLWTNHERKASQARAFKEQNEYILPVRLDSTNIPGIHPTVGYLDGTKYMPTYVANQIAMKLGKETELAELLELLRDYLGGYKIEQDGVNLIFTCEAEQYEIDLPILMLLEAMRSGRIEVFLHSSIFVQ